MAETIPRVLVAILLAAACGCSSSRTDVIQIDDDDPVMTQAIADARASVDQFITALESPGPGVTGLSIKAKFEDGDIAEYMWLKSVTFSGGEFSGVIDNVPDGISTVQLGDRVQISKQDLSDWMYLEDGKLRGGYTIRALIELTPEDERPPLPFEID